MTVFLKKAKIMSPAERWIIVVGAIAGLFTWIYDYDFFLNPGGPERPISSTILRATHLEYTGMFIIILWPLLVLVVLGAAVAFGIFRLLVATRKTERN